MADVGISQVVFQPGVSVKCSPWPRAEDESRVHVPLARQDARHECPRLNGWHPVPPASVPPAPAARLPTGLCSAATGKARAPGCQPGAGVPAGCRGARSPAGMESWSRRSAAFDCAPQPAACCPDWMAELPDALPLSRLSIPGTHDSLSLFGGRRLRCQSWGLEAQLAAGIRFLDVRCKLRRGELGIYHLCTFQRASLRGVLRRTLRFLRAHPGEAVLMRIKEELPGLPRARFAAQLRRCLLEEGQGCVWCREEVPTLGQVRGKIVVLEALTRDVLGIPYERLSISDSWNVLSLERKWARVRRHLEKAAGGDPATMYLTFCSGNGLFTWPEEVARFVNPRCWQHLRRRGQPVRWGVLIMDFPGSGLLRLILDSNGPRDDGRGTAAPGSPTVPARGHRDTGDTGNTGDTGDIGAAANSHAMGLMPSQVP
ncbi:1-phosphatidylinositol phosphodiesterase-like [Parus major]|uniref:1-phosphatidylinositol phosphodiesterase-like n=1 Tax=Parus major TaxID=9157 RepID=UPI001443CF24|nr:1-phosphatidylinositol phosphodiesterase-like [Parus major]